MMKIRYRSTRLPLAAAVAATLAACATSPATNAQLDKARQAVQSIDANPAAAQYAATDVERARKYLAEAEAAAKKHDDELTNHEAYLAERYAGVAIEHGTARLAEQHVTDADAQREKIRLAAREQEAERAKAQLAQQQQQNAALMQQLTQLQGKQTPRGMTLTMQGALFATGKATLRSGAQRTIDQVAQFLHDHPERHVNVEGFTDNRGGEEYNLELSTHRAEAVRDALVARGIEPDRITARGYGKEFPVAGNSSPGERQLNRRVEIVIGNDNKAVPPRDSVASNGSDSTPPGGG
jgi:outer membrane protein OmpA-like peptidoglycan-associated protein